MKLIGIAGRANSGKDTLAGLILEHVTGQQRAFADPLRRAAMEIFGLTLEQMTDRDLKEKVIPYWGYSPRQVLQLLGTESIRDVFGPDTWVKRAALGLEELLAVDADERYDGDVVVFTDCRFAEEARWIRQSGGVVIHITRPGLAAVHGHVSEMPLPEALIDFVVVNDGSIDDLRHQVLHQVAGWLDQGEHYQVERRVA
ncbi:deoxynucleotide monophosphate kinase family protein [Marinobacterium lutimaris]|uniref:Dephospho-CoA kinase n=1 Tax=Marinobacterium lutimaris TaxID=568106 RepID=A0A1H5XVN8_9GAMM|nr:hypothetical protein [Marinobacterium lutimaris]SEG15507.1 hypothetical protein SAMN05444390_1011513 [Marinobacterium lutimaris]